MLGELEKSPVNAANRVRTAATCFVPSAVDVAGHVDTSEASLRRNCSQRQISRPNARTLVAAVNCVQSLIFGRSCKMEFNNDL